MSVEYDGKSDEENSVKVNAVKSFAKVNDVKSFVKANDVARNLVAVDVIQGECCKTYDKCIVQQ